VPAGHQQLAVVVLALAPGHRPGDVVVVVSPLATAAAAAVSLALRGRLRVVDFHDVGVVARVLPFAQFAFPLELGELVVPLSLELVELLQILLRHFQLV
jgi:hypothetical protein